MSEHLIGVIVAVIWAVHGLQACKMDFRWQTIEMIPIHYP